MKTRPSIIIFEDTSSDPKIKSREFIIKQRLEILKQKDNLCPLIRVK